LGKKKYNKYTIIRLLKMSKLLPNSTILAQLYRNKSIHLSPKIQQKIIQNLQQNQSDLIPKLANYQYSDLISLGQIVFKHSINGRGIASKLFHIALESENTDAVYKYAKLLSMGEITPDGKPNLTESMSFIQALAQKNHPESLFILGLKLLKNPNTDQHKQGLDYLISACKYGSKDACFQLGSFYKELNQHESAFKYYNQAHQLKKREATFMLALYYDPSFQTSLISNHSTDMQKAFKYYSSAAQAGLAVAQHNLAGFYMSGIDLKEFKLKADVDAAIEFWKMAAEQGFEMSCLNLARMYMNGTHTNKDLTLARKYLEKVENSKSTLFIKEAQEMKNQLEAL
jgi:TPR repeat protein